MIKASDRTTQDDPFDLQRFTSAQERVYDTVLTELRRGKKRTHWMWYIFPQIDGLGFSSTSKRYAIKSLEEARRYLEHPILGPRLQECAEVLLAIQGRSVAEIFGYPDDLKLRSSMTLFMHASDDPRHTTFAQVLRKYYHNEQDTKTLAILNRLRNNKIR